MSLQYRVIDTNSTASNLYLSVPPAATITPLTPWVSDRRLEYPATLAIVLPHPVNLRSITLTAHEAYVPSEIEIYLGKSPPLQPKEVDNGEKRGSFGAAVFSKLGFITFRGAAGPKLERETRVISNINTECEFVKLIVHEPVLGSHTVKFNKGQQVGLVGLRFKGDPIGANAYIGMAPENHSLLVAEYIGVEGVEGLGEMERALLEAGVGSSIVGGIVRGDDRGEQDIGIGGLAEGAGEVDEETRRLAARGKELCGEAVKKEDFVLAKRRKNAVDTMLSLGQEISKAREEEAAAVKEDDFDLATRKKAQGKGLKKKRDKVAEEGGIGWGEEIEVGESGGGGGTGPEDRPEDEHPNVEKPPPSSPRFRIRVRGNYKFVANPIVPLKDEKKAVQGNKEFEEIVIRVQRRSQLKVESPRSDELLDVLTTKVDYKGEGSASLLPRTKELMEKVFGSSLLAYLLPQQNVGMRKLGFNAITAAIKNKHLDVPGTENLLNILVHIASLALRDSDDGVHACGIDMCKAIFCSPNRESVFVLEGVVMGDLRACVGECVRGICKRAAFAEEDVEKVAKATVVSLARQEYLGPGFIAGVGWGEGGGYEEEAGELFCIETLVDEFGFVGDSRLDFEDVMGKVGRSFSHVNHNVWRRGAGVTGAVLRRGVEEEIVKDRSKEWQGLGAGGGVLLDAEYKKRRYEVEKERQRIIEEKAKAEAEEIAKEAERIREEAKKIAERLEAEMRWKSSKRGKALFQFVGEVMVRVNSVEELEEEDIKENQEKLEKLEESPLNIALSVGTPTPVGGGEMGGKTWPKTPVEAIKEEGNEISELPEEEVLVEEKEEEVVEEKKVEEEVGGEKVEKVEEKVGEKVEEKAEASKENPTEVTKEAPKEENNRRYTEVNHITKQNIEEFDKMFKDGDDTDRPELDKKKKEKKKEKKEEGKGEETKGEEGTKESEEKKAEPEKAPEPEKPKEPASVTPAPSPTPDPAPKPEEVDKPVVVKKKKGGGCVVQ